MNTPENRFKKYLLEVMGTRWDVQSHEDKHSTGIPDLSYGLFGVNGWIELKYVDGFPVRKETLVAPKKYTPSQVNWLRKRGKKGGHCYVMVKVGQKDYFIFNYDQARNIANGITQQEYKSNSLAYWSGSIDPEELCAVIAI